MAHFLKITSYICRVLLSLCRRTLGLSPEVGSLVLLCRYILNLIFGLGLPPPPPPIQSHSPLCIATQSSLTAVGQKKASSHSLVFTRDTRNCMRQREEFRSDKPDQYLNSKSHGQNLTSTPGKAEPNAQYFYENSTTGLSQRSH